MRGVQVFFGLGIVLFGVFVLAITAGLVRLTMIDLAGSALIVSALLFWIPGLAWRQSAPWLTYLFIPGALAFAVGAILLYTARAGVREWAYLWAILPVTLGFAFLAIYYLAIHARWIWIVGIVVGGVGLLLFALASALLAPSASVRTVGAIVLLVLGLILVVGALRPRESREV